VSGGDDDFLPRLGRIGNRSGGTKDSMRAFLKGARANGNVRRGSSPASPRGVTGGRRAIIQARFVKLGGGGMGSQRAHLGYLQRERAGKDQERAEFYNAEREGVAGHDWLENTKDDRHHFRFIVSAEDGQKLDDLKPFIRDLMGQMEIDLETRLDWIAVDHFNTEHPHTHIVMSGRRDDGRDLVIPREYLSHGMRERAGAILTRDLGLQTAQELDAKLSAGISERRLTGIDRVLDRQAGEKGEVDLGQVRRHREHYQARLRFLESHGLAEPVGGTLWQVSSGLTERLAALERRDMVAARIEQALSAAGLERVAALPDEQEQSPRAVTGKLLVIARNDELSDRSHAIIDGLDGRVHHYELGSSHTSGLEPGDFVQAKPRARGASRMDRVIEEVAKAYGGTYSAHYHREHDPSVSEKDLGLIRNRLAALSRQSLVMADDHERFDGCTDLVRRVEEVAVRTAKRSPTLLLRIDTMSLEAQVNAQGLTWLDHHLAGEASQQVGYSGLGGEARELATQRRAVLVERGIAQAGRSGALEPQAIEKLQIQSMHDYGRAYAGERGMAYVPYQPGKEVSGKVMPVNDGHGSVFARIEYAKQFTLVPWSRDLEGMRARQVTLSWSFSRGLQMTRGRDLGLSR
tara:strand:+ start:1903 stop:3798 length:1896 start_codon:yes stop_codon:yes gene_type:complete